MNQVRAIEDKLQNKEQKRVFGFLQGDKFIGNLDLVTIHDSGSIQHMFHDQLESFEQVLLDIVSEIKYHRRQRIGGDHRSGEVHKRCRDCEK